MALVNWMAQPAGRIARVAAGVVLIVVGLLVQGAWGWVAGIVGLVALLAGALNFGLIAPLFKAPLSGHRAHSH